jgi:hypothetical protein
MFSLETHLDSLDNPKENIASCLYFIPEDLVHFMTYPYVFCKVTKPFTNISQNKTDVHVFVGMFHP